MRLTEEIESLALEYGLTSFVLCCFLSYLNYQQIKRSKIQFLTKLKIQRLLNEQSNIIDTMPYGSIIYQVPPSSDLGSSDQQVYRDIRVQSINQTFMQMF